MFPVAVMAVLLANAWAFALFGIDKKRALEKQRRIPESTLLQAALFGGIFGAYLGRANFRHKTRKESFSIRLHLIAMIQAGIAAGLAWVFLTPG